MRQWDILNKYNRSLLLLSIKHERRYCPKKNEKFSNKRTNHSLCINSNLRLLPTNMRANSKWSEFARLLKIKKNRAKGTKIFITIFHIIGIFAAPSPQLYRWELSANQSNHCARVKNLALLLRPVRAESPHTGRHHFCDNSVFEGCEVKSF